MSTPKVIDYSNCTARNLFGNDPEIIASMIKQLKKANAAEDLSISLRIIVGIIKNPCKDDDDMKSLIEASLTKESFNQYLMKNVKYKFGMRGIVNPMRLNATSDSNLLVESIKYYESAIKEIEGRKAKKNRGYTLDEFQNKKDSAVELLNTHNTIIQEIINNPNKLLNPEQFSPYFTDIQIAKLKLAKGLFEMSPKRLLQQSGYIILAMTLAAINLQFEKLPNCITQDNDTVSVRRNSTTIYKYYNKNLADKINSCVDNMKSETMPIALENTIEILFELTGSAKLLDLLSVNRIHQMFDAHYEKALEISKTIQQMFDDDVVEVNFRTCLAYDTTDSPGSVEKYNKLVLALENERKALSKFLDHLDLDHDNERVITVKKMPPGVRMLNLQTYSWAEMLYLKMSRKYGKGNVPTPYTVLLNENLPESYDRTELIELLRSVNNEGLTVPLYWFNEDSSNMQRQRNEVGEQAHRSIHDNLVETAKKQKKTVPQVFKQKRQENISKLLDLLKLTIAVDSFLSSTNSLKNSFFNGAPIEEENNNNNNNNNKNNNNDDDDIKYRLF